MIVPVKPSRNVLLAAVFPDVDVSAIEGEFHQDPAPELDAEYHGELRYVNVPPTVLARRIEEESNPDEMAAMQRVLDVHRRMQSGIK